MHMVLVITAVDVFCLGRPAAHFGAGVDVIAVVILQRVLAAETSYQILEFFSFCHRELGEGLINLLQ